jgi:hypothetical protein
MSSWESRTGCRVLWKRNTNATLTEAAEHFESHRREAVRQEGREETPFQIRSPGRTPSPRGTPDPDQLPSTKQHRAQTKPHKQKSNDNAGVCVINVRGLRAHLRVRDSKTGADYRTGRAILPVYFLHERRNYRTAMSPYRPRSI